MTPRSNIAYFASILLALTFSSTAGAAGAVDWLGNMSQAMQNENYTGTYVYLYGDKLETLKIRHMRDEKGEKESLFSLNGEAREIIRDNTNVICIWPGSQSVTVSESRQRTPFSEWLDSDLQNIASWYTFSVLGEDRVADRASIVIAITPKDALRYGHRLWIDKENYLLLRSQMLDASGTPVEQMMFTQITLNDEMPAEQFIPSVSQKNYTWQQKMDTQAQEDFSVAWEFENLPAGFHSVSEKIKPMVGNEHLTHHITLSDGLASVSVYVEQNNAAALKNGNNILLGESQMGAVSAFGRTVNQIHVTVVGEVPMGTATKIGRAVKLAATQ